jgi:hypothetical protein
VIRNEIEGWLWLFLIWVVVALLLCWMLEHS